MKDIVIISEFCEEFTKTDNDRFLYLARRLGEKNKVEIITSSFRHTKKAHRREPVTQEPFRVIFLEEPGYPRNVCLQRFRSHYIWGKHIGEYLRKRENKPDVVYCAVPSLTGPRKAAKFCERNHIRFIVDVQDLWPEAFQLVLNIPVLGGLIFAPFRWIANSVYRRADAICGVSDSYCRRAAGVNRKVKDTQTVFLGTELETFDRFAEENPAPEKTGDEIRLAYCGTLGSSYDLTCVIDALAILKDGRIRFIVMGDGPRMEEFRAYAEQKGIRAEFTGRMPYNQMCGMLKGCDITVNPISHNAAQSIINKHADYAASGLPVVSTQENEEYRKLVDEYQMGFNCRNNDAEDLAEKIRRLVDDEPLRKQMGLNARRCAEEKFDRKKTYPLLEALMTQ